VALFTAALELFVFLYIYRTQNQIKDSGIDFLSFFNFYVLTLTMEVYDMQ